MTRGTYHHAVIVPAACLTLQNGIIIETKKVKRTFEALYCSDELARHLANYIMNQNSALSVAHISTSDFIPTDLWKDPVRIYATLFSQASRILFMVTQSDAVTFSNFFEAEILPLFTLILNKRVYADWSSRFIVVAMGDIYLPDGLSSKSKSKPICEVVRFREEGWFRDGMAMFLLHQKIKDFWVPGQGTDNNNGVKELKEKILHKTPFNDNLSLTLEESETVRASVTVKNCVQGHVTGKRRGSLENLMHCLEVPVEADENKEKLITKSTTQTIADGERELHFLAQQTFNMLLEVEHKRRMDINMAPMQAGSAHLFSQKPKLKRSESAPTFSSPSFKDDERFHASWKSSNESPTLTGMHSLNDEDGRTTEIQWSSPDSPLYGMKTQTCNEKAVTHVSEEEQSSHFREKHLGRNDFSNSELELGIESMQSVRQNEIEVPSLYLHASEKTNISDNLSASFEDRYLTVSELLKRYETNGAKSPPPSLTKQTEEHNRKDSSCSGTGDETNDSDRLHNNKKKARTFLTKNASKKYDNKYDMSAHSREDSSTFNNFEITNLISSTISKLSSEVGFDEIVNRNTTAHHIDPDSETKEFNISEKNLERFTVDYKPIDYKSAEEFDQQNISKRITKEQFINKNNDSLKSAKYFNITEPISSVPFMNYNVSDSENSLSKDEENSLHCTIKPMKELDAIGDSNAYNKKTHENNPSSYQNVFTSRAPEFTRDGLQKQNIQQIRERNSLPQICATKRIKTTTFGRRFSQGVSREDIEKPATKGQMNGDKKNGNSISKINVVSREDDSRYSEQETIIDVKNSNEMDDDNVMEHNNVDDILNKNLITRQNKHGSLVNQSQKLSEHSQSIVGDSESTQNIDFRVNTSSTNTELKINNLSKQAIVNADCRPTIMLNISQKEDEQLENSTYNKYQNNQKIIVLNNEKHEDSFKRNASDRISTKIEENKSTRLNKVLSEEVPSKKNIDVDESLQNSFSFSKFMKNKSFRQDAKGMQNCADNFSVQIEALSDTQMNDDEEQNVAQRDTKSGFGENPQSFAKVFNSTDYPKAKPDKFGDENTFSFNLCSSEETSQNGNTISRKVSHTHAKITEKPIYTNTKLRNPPVSHNDEYFNESQIQGNEKEILFETVESIAHLNVEIAGDSNTDIGNNFNRFAISGAESPISHVAGEIGLVDEKAEIRNLCDSVQSITLKSDLPENLPKNNEMSHEYLSNELIPKEKSTHKIQSAKNNNLFENHNYLSDSIVVHKVHAQQTLYSAIDFVSANENTSQLTSGKNQGSHMVRITGMLHRSKVNSLKNSQPNPTDHVPRVSFDLKPTRFEYIINCDLPKSPESTKTHRYPLQNSWYSSGSSSDAESPKCERGALCRSTITGSPVGAMVRENKELCPASPSSSNIHSEKNIFERENRQLRQLKVASNPFKALDDNELINKYSTEIPKITSDDVWKSDSPSTTCSDTLKYNIPSSNSSFGEELSDCEQSLYLSSNIVQKNSLRYSERIPNLVSSPNNSQKIENESIRNNSTRQNTNDKMLPVNCELRSTKLKLFDSPIQKIQTKTKRNSCIDQKIYSKDEAERVTINDDAVKKYKGRLPMWEGNRAEIIRNESGFVPGKKGFCKSPTAENSNNHGGDSGKKMTFETQAIAAKTFAETVIKEDDDLQKPRIIILPERGDYHVNADSQLSRSPLLQKGSVHKTEIDSVEEKGEEYFKQLAKDPIDQNSTPFWCERNQGAELYNPQEDYRSDIDSPDPIMSNMSDKIFLHGGDHRLQTKLKSKTPDALRSMSDILGKMSSLFSNLSSVTTNLADDLENELEI